MLAGIKSRHLYFSAKIWLLCLLVFVCKLTYAANSIDGVRVWPAPENTRIVFDLTNKPHYSYFSLKNPQRLVIDFKDSKNLASLAQSAKNDRRVKRIRTSTAKNKQNTRLVLELASEYKLSVFALTPAGQYGHRLVIDLYDKNKPVKVVMQIQTSKRDIVIGIDAGHGGEDPGSIGARGSYEKRVTLAIAKKLQRLINQEKGLTAVMTRSGDYYVNLNRRTEIARKKRVDFLVSIHADAFRTSKPNGSSVWLVSNKRVESEMANWLINREKNSELLGGGGITIKKTNDNNLAFTLADLSKEHSLEVSRLMANSVIKQLKKITKMHKKKPQHASLAVLKASDIPSVLVETGFISNHKEEKNLNSPKHQQRLAQAIFSGVKGYFLDHPPRNTYYASLGYKKHKVASGESLSTLAQRYKVSVTKIKSLNNLSTSTVRIGQTLKIPRAG
jgi:N-acetylmuramoyl-L-alanine amidase